MFTIGNLWYETMHHNWRRRKKHGTFEIGFVRLVLHTIENAFQNDFQSCGTKGEIRALI